MPRLEAFLCHRAGVPLDALLEVQYGAALEICEQDVSGDCPLKGTVQCDQGCPFRWMEE